MLDITKNDIRLSKMPNDQKLPSSLSIKQTTNFLNGVISTKVIYE